VRTAADIFGDPTPNAVGRKALVPHDGLVVHLDERSAPRVLWFGEDFLSVKMPAGTRVVYQNPAIEPLRDRSAAVRYALARPEGTDPLEAQLRPGMRVTIAMDDVSLPLPRMRRPDMRQTVLTILLKMLADKGVDDVELIIATSFHRRIRPAEMQWLVGKDIFGQFYPERLYNHDAEDPGGMVELGVTAHGERVRINRRAAESDLLIYVNINLVPMDGGSKSAGVGLCDYPTLQAHHTPQTIRECDSMFDHERSALTHSCDRIGKVLNQHLKVFHVETALNNQSFDAAAGFLVKNEDTFSPLDWAAFRTTQATLAHLPRAAKRKLMHSIAAPYQPIAVHAGETFATHDKTLAYCYAQYCVPVHDQSDVVVFGLPYLGAYNIGSTMNPLLVQCLALGYFHNMYRGMPVVKKGGVMIVAHPLYNEFDPLQHPSYIEFFNRVLPETRDAIEMQRLYEGEFAHDPAYIRMYRTGYAYHGVHPFYMWYWGENGRQHVGKVIALGAESREAAERMGWDTAATMDEALGLARDFLGRTPSITLMHIPPIGLAEMHGERQCA
jgi:lactate racemase